jgi:hypothetical protein
VGLFDPKTVQDNVDPAGEHAAGGLARVLPQYLFSQVTTLLNEVEDIDLHVRFDFLGFTLLNPRYRLIRSLFNRAVSTALKNEPIEGSSRRVAEFIHLIIHPAL